MKNLLLALCLLSGVFAFAQQKKVSIQLSDQPLSEVMRVFSEQTGVAFSYSADLVNTTQKVSVNVNQVSPEQALKQVFKGTHIAYRILGNQVILFPPKQAGIAVSGYVREKGTGELLPGATVSTVPLVAGSVTNTYGFFSITVPSDTFRLQFSFIGYKKQLLSLSKDKTEYAIELEPETGLNEVVVTADKNQQAVKPNKIEVSLTEIKGVPMILGERDVVKYIMLSPGIQKGNEGNGYLYVRGGGPDQNLILIDEAVIYNAYHFLGLASLFSGNELRRAELIKGGFSSRYGGRLSSVLDMSMKDGNTSRYGAEATVGVIASKVLVEGPIVKDQSSFLLSFRKSYIDVLAKKFSGSSESVLDYGYQDLHAKLSTRLGSRDRLMLSGYLGQDRLGNTSGYGLGAEDDGISWGNRAASLRWSHQFNRRLFANTSLVYSSYRARIAFGDLATLGSASTTTSSAVQSLINDYTGKTDLEYHLNNTQHIKAGAGFTRHLFESSTSLKVYTPYSLTEDIQKKSANEGFLYLEHRLTPSEKWEFINGIRYSYYRNTSSFHRIEPRAQILFHPGKGWILGSSYALMNQYLHLVSAFNGFGLPSDAWVPSDNRLRPQQSQILTLSFIKNNLLRSGISFSVECYAKEMTNTVSLKEGASFYQILPIPFFTKQITSWSEIITQGYGYSYGSEFLLRKTGTRFSGQLSYTLSKTTLQFEELNNGRAYPATFDRRHDLGVYLAYRWARHFTLSTNWVYGTGNAFTLPGGEYFPTTSDPGGANSGGALLFFENKNSARMQSYQRLDISLQYVHRIGNLFTSAIELSVYNAYNRANPFFYQIEYKNADAGDYTRTLQKVSLFPVMPSLSWTLTF